MVSAHGINRNCDHGGLRSGNSGKSTGRKALAQSAATNSSGGDVLNRFAFVVAAMRAYLVRLLHFVAIRAFSQRGLDQKIMRPSRARSSLRMPSFWIRHSNIPRSRAILAGLYGLLALKPIVFSASPASGARGEPIAGLSNASHSGTLHDSGSHHNSGTNPGSRCDRLPS